MSTEKLNDVRTDSNRQPRMSFTVVYGDALPIELRTSQFARRGDLNSFFLSDCDS